MGRGSLRIYLGAAPGVGKTVAMLDEAHRRLERGTDVVVGYVETHGRPHTAALLEGLEVLPRREVTRRGAVLTELDTAAVLARRPEVVLVDELAHTIVPASPEGPGVAGDSSVPGELERAGRVGWAGRGPRGPHETVAGRRAAARGGHRRHLHGQHPAPRVAQRRRDGHHRRAPARDGARRGGAAGRAGAARRHVTRGAAPPDGPRQRLRSRHRRRGSGQLLPGRQPLGPA